MDERTRRWHTDTVGGRIREAQGLETTAPGRKNHVHYFKKRLILNPPEVIANVKAYLDHQPIEVTRAVLAPGYIGFYLVEVTVPKIVNYGPAELSLEVNGQPSNPVRVYISQ